MTDTSLIFNLFKKLSNAQLDDVLKTAGIVPCLERGLKLQQALIVWFHGDIPSMNEFAELVDKEVNKR